MWPVLSGVEGPLAWEWYHKRLLSTNNYPVSTNDRSGHVGERERSRDTIPGRTSSTYSISSRVLSLPTVRRRLPRASSSGTPIAVSTWEGSREPEVQAEPLDADTPCRSSAMRIASPSMCSKQKEALLESRRSRSCGPVTWLNGMHAG